MDTLLTSFFPKKSARTLKAYATDLLSFAVYMNANSLAEALELLFGLPESQANLIVLHFESELLAAGQKPASINRKLSSIRSLVKAAHNQGLVPWTLEVSNEKIADTGSVNLLNKSEMQNLFQAAKGQSHPYKAARDYAMLRLMFDLALKRAFVAELTLADLDLGKKTLRIFDPRQQNHNSKNLPSKTAQSLQQWLKYRGDESGRLFVNIDHAGKNKGGLSSTSIYRIVRQIGNLINLKVTPEEIRKAAIAEALKQGIEMGLSEADILAFSDHKQTVSLKKFRQSRANLQKSLSLLVSKD